MIVAGSFLPFLNPGKTAMKPRQRQLTEPALAPEMTILVRMLDESYEKKAWHGPNLKGSIRGLSADQAAWRPGPRRHSIAEQVIHAAYWKYVVRRRIRGDLRGSFPLKGSNWFPLVESLSPGDWKSYLALLESEHRRSARRSSESRRSGCTHWRRAGKSQTSR